MNILFHDPTTPPREIDLPDEDLQSIETARNELIALGLTSTGVFEIFSDWQSRRTLTAKRLLASSSVIFAAVEWIGLDMSEVSFFGIKVSDQGAVRFSVFIAIFIGLAAAMFEWSRRIDLAVKRAKVEVISNSLTHGEKLVESVDRIIHNHNIDSADKLFDDFRYPLSTNHADIDSYDAVHFYKRYLKGAGRGLKVVEVIELLGLYGLAAYSVYGLSRLWV